MEFEDYFRFILALVLVVGLIGLVAWGARRFGLAGRLPALTGKTRRLSVIEATMLDPRHRLVLVRRDDTEHLILLGQSGDLLVERGIPAMAAAQATSKPATGGASGTSVMRSAGAVE